MRNKKILIVHGWCQSAKRYKNIKEFIEMNTSYKVTLYECPGFGETELDSYKEHPFNIYVKEIRRLIAFEDYEYIIGHSMGANLILRAVDGMVTNSELILINPVYYNLIKLLPITLITPVLPLMWLVLQFSKMRTIKKIGKPLLHLMFNDVNKCDNLFFRDLRNPKFSLMVETLFTMIFSNWRFPKIQHKVNKTNIIVSGNDKLIDMRSIDMLENDVANCERFIIEDGSHMSIMENYEDICNILLDIIK